MMVRAIVNHPDDVKTERIIDERGVLITLHINPEDMGYVIGRQGQTARSLRTLLKIVGAKSDARVNLKIYEPEEARLARQEARAARGGDNGHGDSSYGGGSQGSADRGHSSAPRHDEPIDTSAIDLQI